jgi:hypothetical protein
MKGGGRLEITLRTFTLFWHDKFEIKQAKRPRLLLTSVMYLKKKTKETDNRYPRTEQSETAHTS